MLILIGSRAAHVWHPDHWKEPNDTDYICTYETFTKWLEEHKELAEAYFPIDEGKKFVVHFKDGNIFEFELAWPGSTAESFLQLISDSTDTLTAPPSTTPDKWWAIVPSMDWLFTLKASHKYLKDSPHFDKTMRDYHLMKHDLFCKIADQDWFKKRVKATYKKKRPRLAGMDKGDFFSKNDGVDYVFDHDTIHVAVAQGDQPAYRYYMKSDQDVETDRTKWDAVDEEVRLNGVLEESYVLALERSQIPYRGDITPRASFLIALSKVCTSITSGYFRRYAYENYYKVLEMYSDDYVQWFDEAVENGTVKKAA